MIDTLKYIAAHYGDDVLKDGTKLLAYYADLAPRENTHRQMLEFLVKCNGNIKLLNVRQENQHEQQVCVNLLVKQLTTQLLMSEEAAYTVCDNFLQAIGGSPIHKTSEVLEVTPNKAPTQIDVPDVTNKKSEQNKLIVVVIIAVCIALALIVGISCLVALGRGNKFSGNSAATIGQSYETQPNTNQTKPIVGDLVDNQDSTHILPVVPEKNKVPIRIYIRRSGYENTFMQMAYDPSGRIETVCISNDSTMDTITYGYNTSGQLVDVEIVEAGAKEWVSQYTFVYDCVKLTNWEYSAQKEFTRYDVEYDNQGLIKLIHEANYWGYYQEELQATYTHDYVYANGKITEVVVSGTQQGVDYHNAYQYDSDDTYYAREYPEVIITKHSDGRIGPIYFDSGNFSNFDVHTQALCGYIFQFSLCSDGGIVESAEYDDGGALTALHLVYDDEDRASITITYGAY